MLYEIQGALFRHKNLRKGSADMSAPFGTGRHRMRFQKRKEQAKEAGEKAGNKNAVSQSMLIAADCVCDDFAYADIALPCRRRERI